MFANKIFIKHEYRYSFTNWYITILFIFILMHKRVENQKIRFLEFGFKDFISALSFLNENN